MRKQRIMFVLSTVVVVSLLLTGCLGSVGGGGSSTASLSGKITYAGEDYDGQVVIQVGNGQALTVEGGSYTLTDLKAAKEPVILSAKAPQDGLVYYTVINLKSGSNKHDIELLTKEEAGLQYLEAAAGSITAVTNAIEEQWEILQQIDTEEYLEIAQFAQSMDYLLEAVTKASGIANDGQPGSKHVFPLQNGGTVKFILDDPDGLLFPLKDVERAKLQMELYDPDSELLGEGSLVLYIDDQNDNLWTYEIDVEIMGTEITGTAAFDFLALDISERQPASIDFEGRISSELLTVNGNVSVEFDESPEGGFYPESLTVSGTAVLTLGSVLEIELNGELQTTWSYNTDEEMTLPTNIALEGLFRLNDIRFSGSFSFEGDPADIFSAEAAFNLSLELPNAVVKLVGTLEQSKDGLRTEFEFSSGELRIKGLLEIDEEPRLVLEDTVWPITITAALALDDEGNAIIEGKVFFEDVELEGLRFSFEILLPMLIA